ncbi:hypothetical protein SmJEL517_g03048 [Synchytrium microbalum]|uniref:Uncharacterized protein n=1 Tax=Synchytrium microbalum TaxID=1806994 RepID=A0A507C9S5_9FUNG|nr:uncharacterized protein SmJEL517_g03048 [Synchytrium microbalum]TPX34255.1 hypothetical protein SmJEL517_g03048 [Synchytrium microbalum]
MQFMPGTIIQDTSQQKQSDITLLAKYGSRSIILFGNWSSVVTLSPYTKALPTAIHCIAVLPKSQADLLAVAAIHDVIPATIDQDDIEARTSAAEDVARGDVSKELIPYLSVVLDQDQTVAIVSLGSGLGMLTSNRKDDDVMLQLRVLTSEAVNQLTRTSPSSSLSSQHQHSSAPIPPVNAALLASGSGLSSVAAGTKRKDVPL